MEDKEKLKQPNHSELSDEQLGDVAGGLEAMISGARQVTTCDNFVCCWCGCRKASASAKSHVCEAQSGMGRTPSERIESVFENTCEWCEYRHSCDKAYTWVGFGSPTP